MRRIIDVEIGNGEGANLVVGRHYRAQLADWGPEPAMAVLRHLLEHERGAYWTYLFFTGERYLVGASPERHVSVHGGDVRMNPISGTFRLAGLAEEERKARLLEFLADEKEIYELFMVVDEELKMMCDLCTEGGQVLGPFLKPMTHLVHTEYLLAGRTTRDVREVLRDTMYAATVTGAPVENACRLIKTYETEGRGYYGAALALLGRDGEGAPTADSPIVIRTADVSPDGALKVTAGATLVRDSDPASEVAETWAKAGGILTAFGLREAPPAPTTGIATLAADEDVLIALASRNQRLSTFWLTDQGDAVPSPALKGRTAVILEGEDDFVNMLRHVLTVLGMSSRVVSHRDYVPGALRRRRPGHRGSRPGRPAPGRPPQDRCLPRRHGGAPRLGAAVPLGLPGPPGALRPARDRPGLQGHRLPGDAGPRRPLGHAAGVAGGWRGDRRLLQHLRGPSRRAAPRGRHGGHRPGQRRRPHGARPALPRRAVPRRVRADPERLRAAAGPRPRPADLGPAVGHRPDVVVVDHYDSYTWNLVHLVAAVTGVLPVVVEHDRVEPADLARFSHVVLSPGPGHPDDPADFSVGRDVLRAGDRPVLGVCLGMQGLVTAYGGVVEPVTPAHGEVAAVVHDGTGLFAGVPSPLAVVRYHSLAAVEVPDALEVTARTADGVVMAVAHRTRPLVGVQFHPESVLSEHGVRLVGNFLGVGAATPTPPDRTAAR